MFSTIWLPVVKNDCRNNIHRQQQAPITYDYAHSNYKNNNLPRFYFKKLTITMLFSYGYEQQQIIDNKKFRRIAGDFDCHRDAVVQRGAHRPIQHAQGFTRSHWMPMDNFPGRATDAQ